MPYRLNYSDFTTFNTTIASEMHFGLLFSSSYSFLKGVFQARKIQLPFFHIDSTIT